MGARGTYMRYVNLEWDALLDRYYSTIPRPDRMQVLRQIVHHITDQLVMMGLTYEASSYLVTNRLQGYHGYTTETQAWNAYAWDLR